METSELKLRVLIVEDDGFQALLVKKLVTRLGHIPIGTAATGQEAINKAIELHPDVILMDITLDGDMDGVTAVENIKEKIDLPVIYITGNSDSYNLDRAEQTEFIDYLVKPISSGNLKEPLERVAKLVAIR